MNQIIECVPNFSTCDSKVVKAILDEVKLVEDTDILDHTYDEFYNRLVITFVGRKDSVLKAAINSAAKAIELIDMNKHKGQHPRIGAVDVVPFVPIKNANLKDCVRLAKEFGETLAEKCNVPVYLYGEAATKLERRDIDWIRRGEYENLRENMKEPERKPDFGPPFPHPTAGATITGARKIMLGFNVNLGTPNLQVAKKVAMALHAKKGGLVFVKAMAAEIPRKNMTQIGMSITDYEKTPLHRVFELIKIEAKRYNVPIVGSEFCGLAPMQALIDAVTYYLKIDSLNENRVLEIAVQKAMERAKKEWQRKKLTC